EGQSNAGRIGKQTLAAGIMASMRKRFLNWRIALAVMLGLFLGWEAGGLVSAGPASLGALEGKWKVDVTPDEQAQNAREKGFKDVLTFKVDETFNSEKFKKVGFKDGKYEV